MAYALPPPALRWRTTACGPQGVLSLPPHAFRAAVTFLNRSDTPNLRLAGGGDRFVTAREVEAGKELNVDYNTLEK